MMWHVLRPGYLWRALSATAAGRLTGGVPGGPGGVLGRGERQEDRREGALLQRLGTAVEGYTTAFGEDHTDTLDAKLCATCIYAFECEARTALTPTGCDPQKLLHITEGSGRGVASYTPVGGGRFWEDGTNRT